jgi:hypothetical protein
MFIQSTTHGDGSIELCSPVKNVVYICYLYTLGDDQKTKVCSVTVFESVIY